MSLVSGGDEDSSELIILTEEDAKYVPATITPPRSEFAAVIFHNIPETYAAGTNLDCQYTLTTDLCPTTWDWVGVYKVGWMSYKHFVYYEWAPMPKNYEAGNEAEAAITFPAGQMPKNDVEFYQFCYVSRQGQIRGASTPFQFKQPRVDDFVAVEEIEGSDMLVIRTKTNYLEEKIKKLEEEKNELVAMQEILERERQSLIDKMLETVRSVQSEKQTNEGLCADLMSCQQNVSQLHKEAADMKEEESKLHTRTEDIMEEKLQLEVKVKNLEAQMETLNMKMKAIYNECDEVSGKNQSLEVEKVLYMNHVSSSENTIQGHIQELENLGRNLEESKSEVASNQERITLLTAQLSMQRETLQQRDDSAQANKDKISSLKESLKNMEDRLQAAEHTKELLQEEINAYYLTQEKMTRDVEAREMDSFTLREQLKKVHDEVDVLTQQKHSLKKEKSVIEKKMATAQTEVAKLPELQQAIADLELSLTESNMHLSERAVDGKKLQNDFVSLQQKCHDLREETYVSSGSVFALQTAHETLKDRMVKMKEKCEDLQCQKDEFIRVQKAQLQREHELVREAEDLRDRVYMCSEEYKTLYQKNVKLQKKFDKMEKWHAKGKVRKFENRSKSPTETVIMIEEPVQSDAVESTVDSAACSPLDLSGTNTLELTEQQYETLKAEHDRQKAKKQTYKQQCLEEKDRQEMLRKHYYEQSRKAEEEKEKMKQKSADMQAEFELKYRSMETLLNQKERQMMELRRSMSHMMQDQKDRNHVPASPPDGVSVSGSSMGSDYSLGAYASSPQAAQAALYPVLFYGNPYDKEAAIHRTADITPYPRQQINLPPVWLSTSPVLAYPQQNMYPRKESCDGSCEREVGANAAFSPESVIAAAPEEFSASSEVESVASTISCAGVSQDGSVSSHDSVHVEIDCLSLSEAAGTLDPPLQPTLLPTAKVAAVKSVMMPPQISVESADFVLDAEVDGACAQPAIVRLTSTAPPAEHVEADEDRYQDAAGDGMKICPTCETAFPFDISEAEFEMHIISHFGQICPVCKCQLEPNCSQEVFNDHVNSHVKADQDPGPITANFSWVDND